MKTDLEKFKELFDSVGIKYTENKYPDNKGLSLIVDKNDLDAILYDFSNEGKYEETRID